MNNSLFIPSYFDGSNYAYWKVKMRAFLKSIDECIWLSVVNGWATPSSTVNNEVISPTVANWTRANLNECNWNSKALHALFMEVPPKEFRRVSMCEITKEVLDILQTTHEGTQAVNNSKLQMLPTRFEYIRMKENQIFNEFHTRLNNL